LDHSQKVLASMVDLSCEQSFPILGDLALRNVASNGGVEVHPPEAIAMRHDHLGHGDRPAVTGQERAFAFPHAFFGS
jgi:hypothetical protein